MGPLCNDLLEVQVLDLINCLQVIQLELVIKPGDTETARLCILPLKPGLIRLVGLEWVLNGQAQGRQMFAARTPSHRRSGSRSALANPCQLLSTLVDHGQPLSKLAKPGQPFKFGCLTAIGYPSSHVWFQSSCLISGSCTASPCSRMAWM